jgi:glycosyltransferase involved in cell wall biosynthesis
MARLLIVTDATFYRRGDQIFDQAGLERPCFDDYCAEFEEVRIAARVFDQLPATALQRADGDRLSFVDLRPAQGAGWALAPRRRHCGALERAVDWADALCLRLPAVAGWHAARLARRRRKPAMFELVADPLAVGPGSLAARLEGRLHHHRTRSILRRCGLGSYVNASDLPARYPAAPGAVTATIPVIRLDRARLRAPRTERWQSDRLRLIHVGAFLPVKNQAVLIETLRRARAMALPISLKLVGDGPTRARVERLVSAHGLDDRVTLTGHLPGSERVMAEMVEADALVMPSRREALPRVVLEAMAAGLPVIGSDIPGIRQLLPHWLLFDPASPASLLERCRLLLDDASYRRAGAHGTSKVREFTADILAARRRALLAELRQLALAPPEPDVAAPGPAIVAAAPHRPG